MRELATREYTPSLAYAAAILFAAQFLTDVVLGQRLAAIALHLLFVPVLVLLVIRVDAPPWARLSGYGWAALALLADVSALLALVLGGDLGGPAALATLALVPGAAWIAGASLADPGPARPLGVAAAIGMAFGALLTLAGRLVLVESSAVVRAVAALTLGLSIAWFVVLGRDLAAGKRHWGDPVRVLHG